MDSIKMVNGHYEVSLPWQEGHDPLPTNYDLSKRTDGPSLNDCLHVGPKFNQRINEELVRFWSYPFALVANIEKAFLMISVSPSDCDALRFLWVENPFSNDVVLMILRFKRVVYIVETSGNQRMTSLVVSKTRVAPLKTQSIPRFELLALLARLITNVAESLTPRYSLMPHVCFSDSQVTLC